MEANRPLNLCTGDLMLSDVNVATDSPFHRLRNALDAAGVPYGIHEHAPSVTIADADAHLHFPVERLLKTIAFRNKRGGSLLAGLCGYAQVDYKRLADAAGVSRTQLMQMEPHEVEAELGYIIGGVAPFGLNDATSVYLDRGVLRFESIYCGTGRRDRTLEIAPSDLVQLSHAHVAPIARKLVCEG